MCDPCCSPCGPCGPSPCGPCDPCCAPFEPRACRSRELRSSIMYTTCECIKRNGLQDRCPRAMCQGRSACMNFPVPNCCPASFPLRMANVTMGVNNKRSRCPRPCGDPCGPPCDPCAPPPCCDATACCGPSNPPYGAPSPVPCAPMPGCCPPLIEGGVPDPCVWNCNNTPPSYPCGY